MGSPRGYGPQPVGVIAWEVIAGLAGAAAGRVPAWVEPWLAGQLRSAQRGGGDSDALACSGCGAVFGRNRDGLLVHPEPWCLAMVSGQEHPRPVPGGSQREQEARRDARLLRWLRAQVNQDLRYWRAAPGMLPAERREWQIADCKAKLGLLRWAEHWTGVRGQDYGGRPDVQAALVADLELVMAAVRRLAQGYRGREGWRAEWDLQR